MEPLEIRTLLESDLAFADSLRALAGWNQTMADWRRLLRFGGEGCFLGLWDGIPAAVVTTTIYSAELAWIGMALVHPDFRRRGIGSALLRHAILYLQAHGVNRIRLDATPQGQPNYSRAGFCSEWAMTRWEGIAPAAAASSVEGVRTCRMSDLTAIARLDADAVGASRAGLIEATLRDSCLGLVHENADGLVDGLALAREGARAFYFGPLIARSPDVALQLAGKAFEHLRRERLFWDLPDDKEFVTGWILKQGFTAQRQLKRMVLMGSSAANEPNLELLYGIAGPEWG